MEYKRGDIVSICYDIDEENVQRGKRPFLIVSNDLGNKSSNTIIVCPLTTQYKKDLPTHYILWASKENGLVKRSTLLCEQIMTVNKTSIIERVGTVPLEHMIRINTCLMISLGICL